MKQFTTFFLVLFCFFNLNAQNNNTVNSLIGDESYLLKYGVRPDNGVDEKTRIQTHLLYIEQFLRQQNTSCLSAIQQNNRNKMLEYLHAYCLAGAFPSNYDHPYKRLPCFIDKTGNICAVGYLIERSVGRDVTKKINSLYQYQYLLAINDSVIDKWIMQSGLTKHECAMIQPTYDYKFRGEPNPDVKPLTKTDSAEFVYESIMVDTAAKFICEAGKDPNVEWNSFILKNIVYPQIALESEIQGNVFISCVVKKDGSLSNIKIRHSQAPVLNVEALRIASLPSKWTPAYKNGNPVNSTLLFPIRFRFFQ